MPYCSLDDVKKRCGIKDTIVTYDEELVEVIDEAQSIVDTELAPYVTTPLAAVPKIIRYATADYAAAIYTDRRKKAEDPRSPYFVLAGDKIHKYIENTFKKGKLRGA
jgi:hypothetical protein